ncbi:hypothetical protein PUNSTDRAFT_98525 [Punctularia strigosozonata HHB-11173 SS5]|uniref:uncharacterized protein n=1 Tax=Punctularia strigosozonata (strain HHB-11173) TaxID=741275 RepID=UPI0004417200|nr:uncharacterized protein PUNSTDRAFT_98525 [Punctularia strigosozonata HHB-11173 SS5]EIN11423.1 hypothetical protein PUNSTDRAFT_98525 [Punctularia strigosozonata HHB-11173 SS5]
MFHATYPLPHALRPTHPRRQISWFRPRHCSHFQSAPGDVLLEIATHVESLADLCALALTCSRVNAFVSQALYRDVVLNTYEQCVETLRMLSRKPLSVARHVRSLEVHPHGRSAKYVYHHAHNVAAALEHLVRRLDALQSFVWEAEEGPPSQSLWLALRLSCPCLRKVGTTIGSCSPGAQSYLYDFANLTSFSLTLKPGYYTHHADDFWLDERPEWIRLWNMLEKSPNLEELRIEGVALHSVDARKLCTKRWPKLKRLWLGDVFVQIPVVVAAVGAPKPPFIVFLESHPSLESLQLTRHAGVTPEHLLTLSPESLPRLSEFSGTLDQVQKLPRAAGLKALHFPEPMYLREVTPLMVSGVLHGLGSLTRLTISLVLHASYDNRGLLRTIVTSCPHLTFFDFTYSRKPCFSVEAIAAAIAPLQKLRALHLTMVRIPTEAPLCDGGARIARALPRLRAFTLTLLSRHTAVARDVAPPFTHRAHFELVHDQHGLPLLLRVRETRKPLIALVWGGDREVRYVHDLRPVGHPDARTKGVAELLFERSAAGEETRLMFFCVSLVTLAVWGFAGFRH